MVGGRSDPRFFRVAVGFNPYSPCFAAPLSPLENKWIGGSALIYAGSVYHKLDLWIPDAETAEMAPLKRLIEKRYAGLGRGYVYVSGKVEQ